MGSANPANNSVVMITGIGDTSNRLVCTTERSPCCAAMANRFGDWYFPNGSAVRRMGDGDSFYRSRRDAVGSVLGAVLLHRRDNAMSPTGIYRCMIPGADGMDQFLYVGLYTMATNGSAHICMLLQWYVL